MSTTRADPAPPRTPSEGSPSPGLRLAQAACVVGLLFAAVSVMWGLGVTWLVDTVSSELDDKARAGSVVPLIIAWAAAITKAIAAALPLLAVRGLSNPGWDRIVRVLAWIAAGFLTLYGVLLTAAGLLIEAGVIEVAASANHHAQAWHAYLWDPWFAVWGLLALAALVRARPRSPRTE